MQVSEARLIELLEQVSEQTEKKTKVGGWLGLADAQSPVSRAEWRAR